jgi:hypothetical protein
MENLVYAIVLLPLLGFLINGLFGKIFQKLLLVFSYGNGFCIFLYRSKYFHEFQF